MSQPPLPSRFARGFAVGVLALLTGLLPLAAQTPAGDDDDIAPDVNALKARAEAGQAKAQTQLADVLAGAGDFTNAVVWYRKAAEQGDVAAQLTLATLLVTGRGAAKSPQEAAKWLRAAADRIEGVNAVGARPAPTNTPPYPTNAIVITRSNPPSPPATNMIAAVATNTSRVQRADSLQVVEPALQDIRPVIRPPAVLR